MLPYHYYNIMKRLSMLCKTDIWEDEAPSSMRKTEIGGVCSLVNYSVAYEDTQSNRVFDFHDFVCSLFPKAILFDLYFSISAIVCLCMYVRLAGCLGRRLFFWLSAGGVLVVVLLLWVRPSSPLVSWTEGVR